MDFANAAIGGGVLLNTPGSTAQEEILFATHPELIVAKLLAASMRDDEAIAMSGARHFANHSGCVHFGIDAIIKKVGKTKAVKSGLVSQDGKKRSVFHSIWSNHATVTEKKVFAEECVTKAFNRQKGEPKKKFRCSTKLKKHKGKGKGKGRGMYYLDTELSGQDATTLVLAMF